MPWALNTFCGSRAGCAVDSASRAYHKSPIGGPCRPTAGCFGLVRIHQSTIHLSTGGVTAWLKGTGCKPVGYAYVGSNPTPSTTQPFGEDGCGCSSMVEQQPSKLRTRVRFPSPAPKS